VLVDSLKFTLPTGGCFFMYTRKAVIFANGELQNIESVRSLIDGEDYLIAADGGLYHILALGLFPNLVIGDLDSIEPDDIVQLEERGITVERYPVHKDETDLELAIEAALREGCRQILVMGALGGRLDMTLANISLLAMPSLSGCDVRLEDGLEEVFFIRPGGEGQTIHGETGDRVSLLAWQGHAHGIHTGGLYYPLVGETLMVERTRGISNQMVDKKAHVRLQDGLLLCIHTRQPL
jgi:thiamine pyrophosphokinase